jgi:hypothetical protein
VLFSLVLGSAGASWPSQSLGFVKGVIADAAVHLSSSARVWFLLVMKFAKFGLLAKVSRLSSPERFGCCLC